MRLADHGGSDAVSELSTAVSLKRGRFRLRIGAHNQAIEKSGSMFMDVDVPDFSGERLSLSGVVIGASAAPKNVPIGSFRPDLPIMPTTLREFSPSDSVTAFLRVHQGVEADTREVLVSPRVLDAKGTVVEQADRTLLPEDFFASGSAGVTFPVPVETLAAGPYTLEVQASSPSLPVAKRALAFTVR